MLRLISSFKLFLWMILFSAFNQAQSHTLIELFAKNQQPIFIEVHNTGDGEEAIRDALILGVPKIYIIDLSQYAFEKDFDLFGGLPNVNILLGNPVELLPQVLSENQLPALIWFDGIEEKLVLRELKSIVGIKSRMNTIMIEHFEQYSDSMQKRIIKTIEKINPKYCIALRHADGYGKILVANLDCHDHHSSSSDDHHHDHSSSSDHHHGHHHHHGHDHSSSHRHHHHS